MSNWPLSGDPDSQLQQDRSSEGHSGAFNSMTAIAAQPVQAAPFDPGLPHTPFGWIPPALPDPAMAYPATTPYMGTSGPHMSTYPSGPSQTAMMTPQALDGTGWMTMNAQPVDFVGSSNFSHYPVTQHNSLQLPPESAMMSRRMTATQVPPSLVLHSSSSNTNSMLSSNGMGGSCSEIMKGDRSPPTSYDELSPDKPEWPNDGDAIRRDRFLARNRQAATRCRMKKKEWQSNLQARAESMNTQKQALEAEAFNLRNELVYLKNICLRHTDCKCHELRSYLQQAVSHQRPVARLYDEPGPSGHERTPRARSSRRERGTDVRQTRPGNGQMSLQYSAQLDSLEDEGDENVEDEEEEIDVHGKDLVYDDEEEDKVQPDMHEASELQSHGPGTSRKRRRDDAT